MIEDPVTKSLKPFDFDHLIDNVPKLRMLNYEIEHLSLNPPIDSSDMLPENWRQICSAIDENYDRYDGFVVLHGTDTMAYTASALSFMLENLTKPVIITGSQLPIGEVRTDGEENLITALQIAAARHTDGRPMVQEVAILFENYLWRGNRSTKRSADNFNAFRTANYPELAKIGLGIAFAPDALDRNRSGQLDVSLKMDPAVTCIDLYPGLTKESLEYQLNQPNLKGVVLRTYGAGNGPTAPWFTDAIREACDRGLVVLNISQCLSGSVMPNRYKAGEMLAEAGAISGHDMTFEAAITKMMYLFGLGLSADEVKRAIATNLAGELTNY